MEISPEQQELSDRLKDKYSPLRVAQPNFYAKALEEAEEYHGCYLTFWRYLDTKYFVIYRKDRKPFREEFLPFLQTLFDNGPILEVSQSQYSMEFVQGDDLYETKSMADQMGEGITEYADKQDEVEQFDFDKTSTAKRMNDAKQD